MEVRHSDTDYAERSVSNIGEKPLPVQGKVRHLDLSVTDLECKGRDGFNKTEREIMWDESGSARIVATLDDPASR